MSEESTERMQVFAGKIRKCPSCGAQITTDTAKCPSCGFIIEKETVSSAMDDFAKKFVSLNTEVEKKDFVETYPIPNNKEDIRGFLNYAASQRDKDYATSKDKVFWVTVWNNKCRLIINQAFDVFGSDAEFMQYLRGYKKNIEDSVQAVNKIKTKLLLGKIAKISAVAVLVLAVAGVFVIKEKKRSELIAGCVVPKENVVIDRTKYFEVLSDAKIETTNISKRIETTSGEPVWCLDTTVTVDVKQIADRKAALLEKRKKTKPDYYNSPDFTGEAWFRTLGVEDCIDCAYQSKSVTVHGFDNVHSISDTLLNRNYKEGEEKPFKLEIRLTQIAGSKKECEELAINLHKRNVFSFDIPASFDQYHIKWVEKQGNK